MLIDKDAVLKPVDREKSAIFYRFLANAAKRYNSHDLAKQRLEREISRLRKATSPNIPEEISDAEKKLTDALFRERKLQEQQRVHSDFHQKLQEKIKGLERRLVVFLENKKQREARIRELESKVAPQQRIREEKLKELVQDIARVEQLYDEAAREGAEADKLQELKERITSLKSSLA